MWIAMVIELEGPLWSEMLYHIDSKFKNCWSLTFCVFYLQKLIGEVFNIVSQQSTARPGCIIELDAITNQVKTCLWIDDNILYPGVLYMHMFHSQKNSLVWYKIQPTSLDSCSENLIM